MFEPLAQANRLLMEASLAPLQGTRFQPTGFAHLGAATYQLAGKEARMLLVESAQSMANRLEQTIIGPDFEIIEDLRGLPYIRARLSGASESTITSLVEPHRLNSPYIIPDKDFQQRFTNMADYRAGAPLNWQKIARAVFYLDVNSLLHGIFLANLGDGRIKIPRAISAFIEAENVTEAVSGGVKFSPVDPSGTIQRTDFGSNVYQSVPFQRVEYTAERITAYFNLDLGLIRSYALGQDAEALLTALALYKVGGFLETGTRLRTACDLKVVGGLRVTEPEGFSPPAPEALLDLLKKKIEACRTLFADPPITELQVKTKLASKKEGSPQEDEEV